MAGEGTTGGNPHYLNTKGPPKRAFRKGGAEDTRSRSRGAAAPSLSSPAVMADLSKGLGALAAVRARANGKVDHDAGQDPPDGPGFISGDGSERQADDQHPKEYGSEHGLPFRLERMAVRTATDCLASAESVLPNLAELFHQIPRDAGFADGILDCLQVAIDFLQRDFEWGGIGGACLRTARRLCLRYLAKGESAQDSDKGNSDYCGRALNRDGHWPVSLWGRRAKGPQRYPNPERTYLSLASECYCLLGREAYAD